MRSYDNIAKTEALPWLHVQPLSGHLLRALLQGWQRDGEEFLDMPAVAFVAPILPNREEEWRRFVQEVAEERLREYEELRRRLGVYEEAVWLARTPRGEMAIAYLEAENPERIVPTLAASEEPFDLWFKGKLLEFHGSELAHMPRRYISKLIFAYRDILRPDDSRFPGDRASWDIGGHGRAGDGHR